MVSVVCIVSCVVLYRAKVEPPPLDDVAVASQPSDSTDTTGQDDSSFTRTRKLFPETWLWENLHVTGYFPNPQLPFSIPIHSDTNTYDASGWW